MYELDVPQELWLLASCPWGTVTANGVDLLTEIYVIYMEAHTSHCAYLKRLNHLQSMNTTLLPLINKEKEKENKDNPYKLNKVITLPLD